MSSAGVRKQTIKERLRRLELFSGVSQREEKGDELGRVDLAIERALTGAVQEERPSSKLLRRAKLADLFGLAIPADQARILRDSKKYPASLFSDLTGEIDQYEDYVTPMMENLVSVPLTKSVERLLAARPKTADRGEYDRLLLPLINANLALQIKKRESKSGLLSAMDAADVALREVSIEDLTKAKVAPLSLAQMQIRGVARIVNETGKASGSIVYQTADGMSVAFDPAQRLKIALQSANRSLSGVADKNAIDKAGLALIDEVERSLHVLKMDSDNGPFFQEAAAGSKAILGRLSAKGQKKLFVESFNGLFQSDKGEAENAFDEEMISQVLQSAPPAEARELSATLLRHKKTQEPAVAHFVLKTELDAGVFPKLNEGDVVGVQKAILHNLASVLHPERSKELSDRITEYKTIKKGPIDQTYKFLKERVYPQLPDRGLAAIVVNGPDPKMLSKNPFFTELPEMIERDRLDILAQAAASGLISVNLIPSLVDKSKIDFKTGEDNTALSDTLLLGLAMTAMNRASAKGQIVVRKGSGQKEPYQPPALFRSRTLKQKVEYILSEGPPIEEDAVETLRKFFEGTGISVRSYESRYESLP